MNLADEALFVASIVVMRWSIVMTIVIAMIAMLMMKVRIHGITVKHVNQCNRNFIVVMMRHYGMSHQRAGGYQKEPYRD